MSLLILKIILQILAVTLAILIGLLDYVWHDKRTRRFKKVRYSLFVLSSLFLIGSVILTILDDSNNNKKEEELKVQLQKVQEQNDGLQKGIAILSEKSSDMLSEQRNSFVSVLEDQKKLGINTAEKIGQATDLLNTGITDSISKQKNVLKQQQTTLDNLTSKDSYCYILPSFLNQNTVLLILANDGEYPLYDVTFEMVEPEVLEKMYGTDQTIFLDFVRANTKYYNVGTIGKAGRFVDRIDLMGVEKKKLKINFYTRFKGFSQTILFSKVNEEWLWASRLYEIPIRTTGKENRKLIKEVINSSFPKDADGQVNWE